MAHRPGLKAGVERIGRPSAFGCQPRRVLAALRRVQLTNWLCPQRVPLTHVVALPTERPSVDTVADKTWSIGVMAVVIDCTTVELKPRFKGRPSVTTVRFNPPRRDWLRLAQIVGRHFLFWTAA